VDKHGWWVVATTTCVSVAIVAIYLVVSFAVKSILNLELSDSVAIFLALTPFVVYLVVSGKVTEFRGGGFEIKFKEASEKEVQFEQQPIEYDNSDIVWKEKLTALPKIKSLFSERRFMVLGMGLKNDYDHTVLKEYLEELTRFDYFKYVVLFERERGKFEGFVSARTLLVNLEDPQRALDIVSSIKTNEPNHIPGFNEKHIQKFVSNREALRVLDETHLADIPVTDVDKRFLGFASRETIAIGVVRSLLASKKLGT
jgi:hypothetical protein